ncbi:TPA: hypothetical protein ACH3X1_014299 [Trebouxia sp. C0004]
MQRQHPDSAFLLHVEGGKDVETFQVASRQLSNIFMQPGWDQHVLQQLRQVGVPVVDSSTASARTARAAKPARKRAAEDMTTPANNPNPPRQRRKMVPTSSMPAGSSEWYHSKLSANPSTYFVPLADGAWALPDCNVHQHRLLVHRPIQVVVPIRPSSSAHAQPYAYWTDGTFVLYNAISGQLRCSQDSHKGQCPHIKAVNSHMQENGSDAFDDDEQDYSQAWASKMDRQWLFRCPECGDAPPVLVGDAAAKSIQKKFYCGQSVTEPQAGSVPQARPHTRAQRCLFAAAADRRLIGAFASSVRNDGRTAFGHQNLSPAQQF